VVAGERAMIADESLAGASAEKWKPQ